MTFPPCRPAQNARRIAASAIALTAFAGALWCHWLNAVPAINIPAPPPLPEPNGYDRLLKIRGRIVFADTINSAGAPVNRLPSFRRGRPYSVAEMEQAVEMNRDILDIARSSLNRPYRIPYHIGYDARAVAMRSENLRQIARLFRLEAQVHEAHGDPGGAAQSYLDAIQLGADLSPQGGGIVDYMTAVAIESVGRQHMWALVGKLSAADARAAAHRLEEIDARSIPLAETILNEKWSSLDYYRTKFRNQTAYDLIYRAYAPYQEPVYTTDTEDADAPPRPGPLERLRAQTAFVWDCRSLCTHSKTRILNDQAAYMDALAARTRQPYAPAAQGPALPDDALNQRNLVTYPMIAYAELDARMQDRLLATAIALRAYRAEHGDYPASLNDLVEDGYLSRLPIDPYSASGAASFPYRRFSKEKYLLYSVGPDGKDDGGKPIPNRYFTMSGMIGDFVVGANTYPR